MVGSFKQRNKPYSLLLFANRHLNVKIFNMIKLGEIPSVEPTAELKRYSLVQVENSPPGHCYATRFEQLGKTVGWREVIAVLVHPDNIESAWDPDFFKGPMELYVDQIGQDWPVDKGDVVVEKLGEPKIEIPAGIGKLFSTRRPGILSLEELVAGGYLWIEPHEGHSEIALYTKGRSPVFFCSFSRTIAENGEVETSKITFQKK